MDRTGKMDMARGDGKYKVKQGDLHNTKTSVSRPGPIYRASNRRLGVPSPTLSQFGPQILYA
jgi:hypothetical protein